MTRHSITPVPSDRGFTLVEAVISMLVAGVMLVAALNTLGGAAKGRTVNASLQQGPALAAELMAEILHAAYEEPDDTPVFGLEAGESDGTRTNFDDIDDYHGWTCSPPQQPDGTAVANTTGWTRQTSIGRIKPSNLNTSMSDTGLKKITVIVTDPYGKTNTLEALKSQFGPQEQSQLSSTTVISAVTVKLQIGNNSNTTITTGTQLLNRVTPP